MLGLEEDALSAGGPDLKVHHRSVAGHSQVSEVEAKQLLPRIAIAHLSSRVRLQDRPIGGPHEQDDVARLGCQQLISGEHVFGTLASGDVPRNAKDSLYATLVVSHRNKPGGVPPIPAGILDTRVDLDRLACLEDPLQTAPHGRGRPPAEKIGAQGSHELLSGTAHGSSGPAIDKADPVVAVDDIDKVRRRLDQYAVARLACPQTLLVLNRPTHARGW